MSSKTLELRQKNAMKVNSNGDYEVSLPYNNDLTLEDGDTLQLQKVFIDTEADSSQKINIPNDLTLTMTYYYYYVYSRIVENLATVSASETPMVPSASNFTIDNQPYMVALDTGENSGGNPTTGTVKKVRGTDPLSGSFTQRGFGVVFTAYMLNFDPHSQSIKLETVNIDPGLLNGQATIEFAVNIDYQEHTITDADVNSLDPSIQGLFRPLVGQLTPIFPTQRPASGEPNYIGEIIFKTENDLAQRNLVPLRGTSTISLLSGDYTPQDLVKEMNRQVQLAYKEEGQVLEGSNGDIPNGQTSPVPIYQNSFLQSQQSIGFNNPRLNPPVGQNPNDRTCYLVRQDCGNIVRMNENNAGVLVGASFVEFDYKTDTNQFTIDFIHTPYYTDPVPDSNTPAQIAVGYLSQRQFVDGTAKGTPENLIPITKNGGIVFQQLTSLDNQGGNTNFWTEVLGFNLSSDQEVVPELLVSHQTLATADIPTRPAGYGEAGGVAYNVANAFKMVPPLKDGKNMTGGYFPMSASTDLVGSNATSYWEPISMVLPADNTVPSPFLSTATDTINIQSNQVAIGGGSKNDGGYFLVSVQGNFLTDYYSNNQKENIVGIVSRYYEINSFTSGTSDDAVVYQHKGQPITLSDFKVRILTPSKELAPNLGDGTSVFLEIIKAEAPEAMS